MLKSLIVGKIATNCYIVDGAGGLTLLVDPGAEAGLITAALAKAPDYILFTHGHYDHVAALPDVLSFYAQNNARPKIAIHKGDALFLGKEAYKSHCRSFASIARGDTSFVDASWKELPAADILLEDGEEIAGFKVMHLPGHSGGSAGFYDEKNGLLLSGDTLFRNSIGRSDLPESSPDLLEKSIARIMRLPEGTAVYPGHGLKTTIGREKLNFSDLRGA